MSCISTCHIAGAVSSPRLTECIITVSGALRPGVPGPRSEKTFPDSCPNRTIMSGFNLDFYQL